MAVIVICVLISLIVAIVATWINHSSGAPIGDAASLAAVRSLAA